MNKLICLLLFLPALVICSTFSNLIPLSMAQSISGLYIYPPSNSKVGINTNSTNYPLDVTTPSSATQIRFGTGGSDQGGYLISTTANQAFVSGGAAWSGSGWVAKSTTASILGSNGGPIQFYTNTGLTAGSTFSPALRMTIDGSGNVGIGAPIPASKLQVVGDVTIGNTGDATTGQLNKLNFAAKSGVSWGFSIGNETGSILKITSGNPSTQPVVIDSVGQVGIGTTSPTSKLQVAGDIKIGKDGDTTTGQLNKLNFAAVNGVSWGFSIGNETGSLLKITSGNPSNIPIVIDSTGKFANDLISTGPTSRAGGTYLGLFKNLGSLPNFPNDTWATLKTDDCCIFFSANGLFSAYMDNAGGWHPQSSRSVKENYQALDLNTILSKIDQLPVMEWNYKSQDPTIKHIGPFAEDFHSLFGLSGTDTQTLNYTDENGVALAGIKALLQQVKDLQNKNAELEVKLNILEEKVNGLSNK